MTMEIPNRDAAKPFRAAIEEAEHFGRPGFEGFIQVPIERGLGFSALTIWVDGEHPRKRIIEGTRTYYVAEGTGTFTLDDEIHEVEEGDLYVVPEGGEYSYGGRMTLFEMNIPSDLSISGDVVDEKLGQ